MIAVDTSVLIYRIDSHDLVKQANAAVVASPACGAPATDSALASRQRVVRFLRAREDQGLTTRSHARRYSPEERRNSGNKRASRAFYSEQQ